MQIFMQVTTRLKGLFINCIAKKEREEVCFSGMPGHKGIEYKERCYTGEGSELC
jgi:hypothetical protein